MEERLGSPPTPSSINDLPNGTILTNQFRVEKKLGGGGMGTVYRCLDLTVQRQVAIKVLHPHLVGMSKWLLRFQQEARAIARLDHPNIVGVKQLVTSQDGMPFIVMDYVKGTNLSDILSIMGMLAAPRAVQLMSQVADALAHAHENKVVHRDLKPSNIIVVKGTDVVKILDFGIAKIGDAEESTGAVKLTQTGEVFGSPAYMSPEQVLGKAIDGRSDQYSFGCVLYECLTGTPPFVSNSPVEVMMQHVNDTPVPLSQASLGTEFELPLENVVAKLLAKNPADRYDSMIDVKNALQRAISPDKASADDVVDRRFEPVRQSKSPVLLASAFVIGCIVTGVVAFVVHCVSQPATTADTHQVRSEQETDRMLLEAHELANENFVFRRTVLKNGDIQFNFGNENMGKVCYRANNKSVGKHMRRTLVVPKDVPLSLEVSAKTMINQPTVLELFRQDNVTDLTIGSEGVDDIIDMDTPNDEDALQRSFVYVQPFSKSVTNLVIQSATLNSAGLKFLDLDSFSHLGSLRLAKMILRSQDIAKLKVLSKLHNLDLSFTAGSIAPITHALEQSQMASYVVQGCGLKDADLEAIGKLKTVGFLSLSYNRAITGRGLRHLEHMPMLSQIELTDTSVGPDAIEELTKMHNLTDIRLPKELWSPADLDHLRRLLPKRNIQAIERKQQEDL
jgi:hypothetical protein